MGSLKDGLAASLTRMLNAWSAAEETIANSRRVRREAREARLTKRGSTTDTPTDADSVVWSAPDRLITCRVICHSRSEHEVVVCGPGDEIISRRTFGDPVEAIDESSRLRRLFVDAPPSHDRSWSSRRARRD